MLKTKSQAPRGGAVKPIKKRKRKSRKNRRGHAFSRERLVKSIRSIMEVSISQPSSHPKRSSASVLSLTKKGLGLRPRRAPACLPPSFLRAARSVQPVPREATRSACTPATRREAGVQAGLNPGQKRGESR
ncbi:conserved hypothetical protein (plasmid) [Beijerinckia indica subsp. indica ATCC 9039]|uniref:Uncharacterized protein n=1 Tax=Beijerinckia indica subsp. indica (strain ATCC 9039 / DSM 1715 / NCIMB 8712) TaxID=395963 RepID=B2IL99_BEII9|nr:conserved hypothetical protein [Beijerinckia indica subsp. indica ATCC 9039]